MTVHITNRFKIGKHRYSYRRFYFQDKTIRSDFLCCTNTPKKVYCHLLISEPNKKKKLVFIWSNFSWSALHSRHTTYIFFNIGNREPHPSALFSQGLWSINKTGRGFVREKSLICPQVVIETLPPAITFQEAFKSFRYDDHRLQSKDP